MEFNINIATVPISDVINIKNIVTELSRKNTPTGIAYRFSSSNIYKICIIPLKNFDKQISGFMCIFKKSDELNILYNNIFYRNIYLLRLLFFIIFLLALALNFQFEKILSQNEKINTIVSFMNSGLCFLDAHMKVEFINKKFCELLGYQYQELIGRDIHEIFCEPSKKDCVLYEDLKKKGKFEGEIIVNKKKW